MRKESDTILKSSVIEILKDKDCNKAYAYTREICAESVYSDQYYQYFDDLLSILKEENSYYNQGHHDYRIPL